MLVLLIAFSVLSAAISAPQKSSGIGYVQDLEDNGIRKGQDDDWTVQEAILTVLRYPGYKERLQNALNIEVTRNDRPTLLDDSETCLTCVDGVDLLYAALYLGLDYPDLRDTLIDICIDAVNAEGQRGEVICQPVLDSFGPELTIILREKNGDGESVCIGLNICDPDAKAAKKPSLPKLAKDNTGKLNTQSANNTTIKFVHLADVHLEESYLEGSAVDCGLPVCCRSDSTGNGTAGKWGDYVCNTPPRTVELYLNYIKDLDPDFIIYTGDNPPHAIWAETREGQLAASRWVAEAMDRILGDYRVLPNIGNHETYPTNLYYLSRPITQELNREFAAMWTSAARFTPEEISTIQAGGYYTTLIQEGLRLVNYNSNYGYIANFYTLLDGNTAALRNMVSWLELTLGAAREAGEKVILSGHHPMGRYDNTPLYGQTITDLCAKYRDIIVLHVIGHTHNDEFMLVTDPVTSEPVGVQIVAPAATGRSNKNPSVRVFTLDSQTFEPLNYDQYNINLLKAAESTEDPELEFLYNAKDEYGLQDLNPESFANLSNRIDTDDNLFERYMYNRDTRSRQQTCDAECKKEELCKMRNSSWDRHRACLKA